MLKKRILLVLYSITLFITASFAWILQKDTVKVKTITYDNTLTITQKNVDMSIWLLKSNGKYEEISNSAKQTSEGKPFKVENVIPNESVSFKIRLHNKAENTISVSLSISKLLCDEKLILGEMVYISTSASSDYANYPTVVKPENRYTQISADMVNKIKDGEYSLVLYNNMQIPPTGTTNYVEIECYFYFDKRMDNNYQGLNFQAVTFQAAE